MRFDGYAALFDLCDRGGDIIRSGAFANARTPLPLLWQHDATRPIGMVERVGEDAIGLKVEASLDARDGTAREVAAMLREGKICSLSFGYRVRSARAGPLARGGAATRELIALDLIEISLVTNPMQPGARVIQFFPEGVST